MYNQILVSYKDFEGQICTLFLTSQDQDEGQAAEYADLAAAFQACTDAGIVAIQFQSTMTFAAEPVEGPYNTVWDRCAILSKIVETGQPVTYALAAPKESIFKADHKTLDMENADVINLVEKMMEAVGDKLGNAMGPIRRGYRTEAKGGV